MKGSNVRAASAALVSVALAGMAASPAPASSPGVTVGWRGPALASPGTVSVSSLSGHGRDAAR